MPYVIYPDGKHNLFNPHLLQNIGVRVEYDGTKRTWSININGQQHVIYQTTSIGCTCTYKISKYLVTIYISWHKVSKLYQSDLILRNNKTEQKR